MRRQIRLVLELLATIFCKYVHDYETKCVVMVREKCAQAAPTCIITDVLRCRCQWQLLLTRKKGRRRGRRVVDRRSRRTGSGGVLATMSGEVLVARERAVAAGVSALEALLLEVGLAVTLQLAGRAEPLDAAVVCALERGRRRPHDHHDRLLLLQLLLLLMLLLLLLLLFVLLLVDLVVRFHVHLAQELFATAFVSAPIVDR